MRCLLLAAAVALLAVPAAAAKDGLQFDRATAHAGDRLVLSSSWSEHPRGLVAYFMPLALAGRWWHVPYNGAFTTLANGGPPRLRGVRRLGPVQRAGRGIRLAFAVPRVRPGAYVLGFWCVPCGSHWTTATENWQPAPRGILRVVRR